MIKPKDKVLVSLSGGGDSVCLFHLLLSLRHDLDFKIGAFHLNHSLRGKESDGDANFVKDLASKEKVSIFIEKRDVLAFKKKRKISLEEAARIVRYETITMVSRSNGFNRIAIAHHADDNAELLLLFLLRGSGMKGVAGMAPVRDSLFIRPFIHTRKHDILFFLEANQIPYRSDSSNTDADFTRNRIRNDLIPKLVLDYNPNIVETLNRFSEIALYEESWIENIVRKEFDSCLSEINHYTASLLLIRLRELEKGLFRRIIRHALKRIKGNLRKISFQHIEDIHELVFSRRSGKGIHLPDAIFVQSDDSFLVIRKRETPHRKEKPVTFCYTVLPPPSSGENICHIKETDISVRFTEVAIKELFQLSHSLQDINFFDMDKVTFPLTLRSFLDGDQFQPIGLNGSQKIKKYFIDHKIGRSIRRSIPLLTSGEQVMAILGYRMDDRFKITGCSKRVLKVELLLRSRR